MNLIEKYLNEANKMTVKISGDEINIVFPHKKKPFKSDVIDLMNQKFLDKWEIRKDGVFVFDSIPIAKKAYKLITNME